MPQSCCTLCSRVVTKVATRLEDQPVCGSCYNQHFLRVACADCGAPTRSYRGQEPAQCARCRPKTAASCVRCHKNVARRSLTVPGGQACAQCRRYFEPPQTCTACGQKTRYPQRRLWLGYTEPVCAHCARSDYRTCSGCRKHRPVASTTEAGTPLCRLCARGELFTCRDCGGHDNPNSRTQCQTCFWRQYIKRRCVALRQTIERHWAREAFDAFIGEWLQQSNINASSRKRAPGYAAFFHQIGHRFPYPDMVTPGELLEYVSVDRLRQMRVPAAWLMNAGYLPRVPESLAKTSVEAAAQQRLLAGVQRPWQRELLLRFQHHLHAYQQVWRKQGWTGEHERFTDRTVTLLLRAAWRFLEFLPEEVQSTQAIGRGELDRFVARMPGHRNALHAFVNYLNRKETLFHKLHLDRSGEANSLPVQDLLPPETARKLAERWLPPHEGVPRRDALLLLLMLVYARNATQACSLRRGDFTLQRDGSVMARFGTVALPLHAKIAAMLRQHLAELEAARGSCLLDQDYVFPSKMPGRHFSPAALRHILAREGVTARQLYTTAVASFFRAGLPTPKTLVETLGISIPTSITYWQSFGPTQVDDMKLRASRSG